MKQIMAIYLLIFILLSENKEKFILYLTLGISTVFLTVLAALTTKYYFRKSRRRRKRNGSSKPPIPDKPAGVVGGINPTGNDCTDLQHFDNPAIESGVEVVHFASRSSLRRAQSIEDDCCSFPRAPVETENNYYYS